MSVSTVSRFLNGQLTLRPDTEERVSAALDALGYAAPARRGKDEPAEARIEQDTIALVVPQIGNAYFSRIAAAVIAAAEAYGLSVLLASTRNNMRKQVDYVNLLREKGISGLIYAGNYRSNTAVSRVIGEGLPVVLVDEQQADVPPVDTVLVDDYAGAYQAATYLLSLGHVRIAFVGGPPELFSVSERHRGWRDALERAGIEADQQLQLNGAFSEEFGAAALSHLLAAAEPPTAVFAASDTIALGLLSAARRLSIDVPRNLSVVGFDDVPAASLVTPRLTTVHTPLEKMADAAVRMLVERLDGLSSQARTAVTSVSLVTGESAAVPFALSTAS
ncbi:substrate-binding domain-containing protein [Streptomyces sp. SID8361]|nr:substrate-binding domain-containing protein [Streptomyces sp. SID8361]